MFISLCIFFLILFVKKISVDKRNIVIILKQIQNSHLKIYLFCFKKTKIVALDNIKEM